jgi:VIT1/CCC1 family predicted Fe2+/Mn2+ transporter
MINNMLEHSLKTGLSFGLTSAIITTLGLMVGLSSGTSSKLVVIGGIITIAVADAFSDSLGIHVSEESENRHTPAEIWKSTLATFFAKFLFALTFLIPVLLFALTTAIVINIAWGLIALSALSFALALEQRIKPWKVIGEHLAIALIVIALTNLVGNFIRVTFGSNF